MTATLVLTPFAHQALSLMEMRELGYRAVDMHARIRVGGKPGGPWTVRVHSWAGPSNLPTYRVEWHKRRGDLASLMHRALDEYAARFVYTPEELAQIQRQSA